VNESFLKISQWEFFENAFNEYRFRKCTAADVSHIKNINLIVLKNKNSLFFISMFLQNIIGRNTYNL